MDPDPNSAEFVESLFRDWLDDPESVPPDWREYFGLATVTDDPVVYPRRSPSFTPTGVFGTPMRSPANEPTHTTANLQDRIDQLIRAFRVRGHMVAGLDPLGLPRQDQPELDPAFYDLDERHMDRVFSTRTIYPHEAMTLRDILAHMRNTYCRSIGAQFMHIDDLGIKQWLQERMEGTENRLELDPREQLRILTRLTDAVIFEDFVQKKYMGAKSFSLEGAESLIPLLDLAIEKAGEQRIDEIVIGMAHRGRLNVLANILQKSPRKIFQEFEDRDEGPGQGDVKYHLGYSTNWRTATGYDVHLSLCFNPSHLEFVDPVAVGRMRAKQDRAGDRDRRRGMVLLIHGDAAFAGEGIVQEVLNMSQLEGYTTGGTLHVIVNNQLGFTTPPRQGRSSTYATDVAKMLQVPIFHVNGEDPEAVAQVVRLAMDFRLEYGRDVVVDMYCYRRRGHNEGDEPAFTQPLMYRAIRKRRSVREGYLARLLELGGVTQDQADEIARRRREQFEAELKAARSQARGEGSTLKGVWAGYSGGPEPVGREPGTSVDGDVLKSMLISLTRLPDDFHPHPKIKRWLDRRAEMARGERPLDWAAGEALAFATLAARGHRVRLSGQDSERGTFSHRHAVLHDQENGKIHVPLQHVAPGQAPVEIINSPLSEGGVLGFEYGYSLDFPEALVMWEAQFGDFVNAAQVMVDQFIASAELKWRRLSGLVMLLPHGLEGQGPEHSSARIERLLALCVDDNMQVAMPTTPAQYFHLLRRQALWTWRKPLVVLTPKSLLRHPDAVSGLDELSQGSFRKVLPDTGAGKDIERVLVCSGKLYYELAAYRAKHGRTDTAIVRVEQLYPLADGDLVQALEPFGKDARVLWVQEEPANMGALPYVKRRWGCTLPGGRPLEYVARPESAAPATGSASRHKAEQRSLIERAFGSG